MKLSHIGKIMLALVICALLWALPALAEGKPIASGVCNTDGTVTWSLSAKYELTISGSGEMSSYTAASDQPWNAYAGQILSVTVEDGVTAIGARAFYGCQAVATVDLPNSVTTIGSYAFYNCSALTAVDLPDQLTTVPSNMMYGCSSLTEVVIPDSVTRISTRAFCNCYALEKITMPANLETIGTEAFRCCYALNDMTLPSKVQNIAVRSFYECGLTSIHLPDSLKSIDSEAFYKSKLTNITVGNGLESIERYAFRDTGITQFIMPDTVTYVNYGAFYGCKSLKTITLSKNLTQIPGGMLQSCSSLTSVVIPDSVTSIGSSAFNNCTKLSSLKLPENLTVIPENMARNCKALTEVNIPSSVTEIGSYAFYSTKINYELKLNENLTTIGEYAFADSSVHGEIVLPKNLTSLGSHAFERTKISGRIEIPAAVTEIAPYVFSQTQISEVKLHEGLVSIGALAFYECRITELTLPSTMQHVYANAFTGNRISSLTLNEGLLTIDSYAFYANVALAKVNIPSTVTTMGEGVFSMCNLAEIVWPDQIHTIPAHTFNGNSAITSFDIPEHITSIGAYAFSGCSNLERITLPDQLLSIGEQAFSRCSKLEQFTLPDQLLTIGEQAFAYSTKIKEISIPASVTSIGAKAFMGARLNALHIPSTVTCLSDAVMDGAQHIGYRASYTYSRDGKYVWPLLTTDGPGAVYEYIRNSGYDYKRTDLPFHYSVDAAGNATITKYTGEDKTVIVPATVDGHTVTTLGSSVFFRTNASHITLPDTLTTIKKKAFEGRLYYGITVIVPASVTNIADSAFHEGISNNITIHTTYGSAAHNYAIANKIRFVLTDKTYDYIVSGDTCTLTAYYGPARIALPRQIDGYTLTAIGENAFADAYVERVILPDTVESIGTRAFYNVMYPDRLSVCFPAGVTTFGEEIFQMERGLSTTVYVIDDTPAFHHFWDNYWISEEEHAVWPRIWDGVAFHCESSLLMGYLGMEKDITLPTTAAEETLTTVWEGAFSGDVSLNSVTIPEGYTTIMASAFGANNVAHVYLPRSLNEIDRLAFAVDQDGNGPLLHVYANSYAHQRAMERKWNFTLIDADSVYTYEETDDGVTITGINPANHQGVFSIAKLINGKNVVGIGANVFTGSQLTHIIVPATVKYIGDGAFSGVCSSGSTYVEIHSAEISFGTDVFDENIIIYSLPDDDASAYASANAISHKPTNGTWENFTYTLDTLQRDYHISDYTGTQTHVTYPAKLFGYPVTGISNDNSNANVTHITIPENVTSISSMNGFSNLQQIDLPDTLTSIGDQTFRYCAKLDSITLPASLEFLGSHALEQCGRVICYAINIDFTYDILPDDVSVYGYTGCTLKEYTDAVGARFVDLSKAKISSDGQYIYSVSGGKATINDYTGDSSEISIPSKIDGYTVTTIGTRAFAYSHATNILVPDSVTKFGDYAFRGTVTDEPLILRVPASVKSFGKKPYPDRDLFLIAPEDSAVMENAIDNDKWEHIYASSDLEFSYNSWYTDNDERVIEGVDGYWGFDDHVTLPDSYGGEKATTVFWDIFCDWVRPVESYTIPEGYTTVVSNAFRNGCAKDIYLPRSLTEFDGGSFPKSGTTLHVYCNSVAHAKAVEYGYPYVLIDGADLYDYTIDGGECTINAYKGTDKEVTIPDEIDGAPVTAIGANAFARTGVTYVTLPGSITRIGSGAFANIWAEGDTIVDATRVDNVTVSENAFDDNTLLVTSASANNGLYKYASENGVRFVKIRDTIDGFSVEFKRGSWTITGYYGTEKDLFIPAELKGIPVSKFERICNEHIQRVTISDQIPELNSDLFMGCPELIEVNLPANMTGSISMAFLRCDKLDCVVIPEGVGLIQSMLGVENIVVLGMKTELDYPIMPAPATVYAHIGSEAHKFSKYSDSNINFVAIEKLDTLATPLSLHLMPMTIDAAAPTAMDMVIYPVNSAAQIWTSDNPSVASVENGIVTGHTDGTANITVTIGGKTATAAVTVHAALRDFTLPAENTDLLTGQTLALGEVSRVPATAPETITYTVSDHTILNVDTNGNVKALKPGEATFTATSANGIVRTCKVCVFEPASALTLSHSRLEIPAFESAQLTATAISGHTTLTNRMVKFTSSDEDVATVSADGIVTLTGNGPCTITVSAVGNESLTAQCEIIVTGYMKAESISVTGAEFTGINRTATLTAEILPAEASDRRIQWSSSNTNIATVDENGVVTGIARGIATITAAHRDGVSATFDIEIKQQASGIILNITDTLLASTGDFSQRALSTELTPANALPEAIEWISSDESIVTVGANGLITAKAKGSATVTARTASGLEATCRVEVKNELDTLMLPAKVTTIEEEAFAGLDNLEAIVLPKGAITIGSRAFAECENLRFIILPASAELIAADAFEGCTNLCILCPDGSSASEFATANGIAWLPRNK